jgi:D-xylose transport system permease protein
MESVLVSRLSKSFRQNLRSYTLVIALALIWLVFGIAKPSFWSPDNVANVIRQMGIIAIMACGMVFVVVTGGIDLSVGYGAGFVSVIAAYLQYYILDTVVLAIMPGIDPSARAVLTAAAAVVLSVGVGVVIGCLQGAVVAYLGVPAFIVTLGGMFVFKSGVLLVTNGLTIKINNRVFANLAQGSLPPLAGLVLAVLVCALIFAFILLGRQGKRKYGIEPAALGADIFRAAAFSFLILAYVLVVNQVSGVPVLVVILACIAIFMSYLSMNTRFGRYTYAIGGNREAARLSGIDIKKTLLRVDPG